MRCAKGTERPEKLVFDSDDGTARIRCMNSNDASSDYPLQLLRHPATPAPVVSTIEARALFDALGVPHGAKQLLAITADPDRSAKLRGLTTPTLLIHGAVDPLVPVAAAHHLMQVIPHARLAIIERMGHDLPAWAMPRLVDLMATHAGM